MKETDFAAASLHLQELLGIDLKKYLFFSREKTPRNFSVIGSLVVVYRYAKALGQKFVVHDMTAGGHKSHLPVWPETASPLDRHVPRPAPGHPQRAPMKSDSRIRLNKEG